MNIVQILEIIQEVTAEYKDLKASGAVDELEKAFEILKGELGKPHLQSIMAKVKTLSAAAPTKPVAPVAKK